MEGTEGWRGQNFAFCFFPLPPQFSFFLPSPGGPFVEFWCCLKRRALKCARLEFSGCRVKPRRQRDRKNEMGAREGKKNEILGGPAEGGSCAGGGPEGPNQQPPTTTQHTTTQPTTQKWIGPNWMTQSGLAQIGLAKVGLNRLPPGWTPLRRWPSPSPPSPLRRRAEPPSAVGLDPVSSPAGPETVSHHELQAARAEQERKIL